LPSSNLEDGTNCSGRTMPMPAPQRLAAIGRAQLELMQLSGVCGTTGVPERLV
jgi:hypothetical protein